MESRCLSDNYRMDSRDFIKSITTFLQLIYFLNNSCTRFGFWCTVSVPQWFYYIGNEINSESVFIYASLVEKSIAHQFLKYEREVKKKTLPLLLNSLLEYTCTTQKCSSHFIWSHQIDFWISSFPASYEHNKTTQYHRRLSMYSCKLIFDCLIQAAALQGLYFYLMLCFSMILTYFWYRLV